MTPKVDAAALLLPELLQQQHALVSQGTALIRQWNDAFPRGTTGFRLARPVGESHTLLRWRKTRGDATVHGRRFELIDDIALIGALPPIAQARILIFEDCRIRLNYEHALVCYRIERLKDLQRHRDALAQLSRRVQTARASAETDRMPQR